jgi:hypothetical protein
MRRRTDWLAWVEVPPAFDAAGLFQRFSALGVGLVMVALII